MKLGGNFFEDLGPGQRLINPVPRTLTEGDVALYIALTGDRNPKNCSDEFARALGFERAPVHDMLVFHIVFGRAVGEISLNSPGNLGYADLRFLRPVYTGDTLRAETETLGWRETSKGDTGVVWVRTVGFNQRDERVLQFYRWVMVNKREPSTPTHADDAPEMPARGVAGRRCRFRRSSRFDASATGGDRFWEDYEAGERIAHPQGMTIEEAEHQLATRLYQNTARVHFNQLQQSASRHGRRHRLRRARDLDRARAVVRRARERAGDGGVERRLARERRRSRATRCSRGATCSSASTSGATTSARCGCGWWP